MVDGMGGWAVGRLGRPTWLKLRATGWRGALYWEEGDKTGTQRRALHTPVCVGVPTEGGHSGCAGHDMIPVPGQKQLHRCKEQWSSSLLHGRGQVGPWPWPRGDQEEVNVHTHALAPRKPCCCPYLLIQGTELVIAPEDEERGLGQVDVLAIGGLEQHVHPEQLHTQAGPRDSAWA